MVRIRDGGAPGALNVIGPTPLVRTPHRATPERQAMRGLASGDLQRAVVRIPSLSTP